MSGDSGRQDGAQLEPGHIARDLAERVSASAGLCRRIACLEADRFVSAHEAVEFAVRRAQAFVAPSLSGSTQRELARRAVIAELAVAWRVSEYSMQRIAEDAYVLCTRLPATLAAMRAGEFGATHARVIVAAVSGLNAEDAVIVAADVELAAVARTTTPGELRRAAKRLLERLQADSIAARHARAFADRVLELESARDGMAWIAVQMRAGDALLIRDRLQQAVRAALSDEADVRTAAQIEADLARDLLLHGTPPAAMDVGGLSKVRPTVHVTVPVLTLLEHDDAPGHLDGYGPVDAETARRLSAQAPSFTRLLTHPVDGTVLDVDRTSYRVPADLRKWLRVRDETCHFPGCTRRAIHCELDHSLGWVDRRGKTAHDNLAHLCSAHHHLKHETAWSVRHLDDAVLEWTSLTGAVYRTTPSGDLRTPSVGSGRLDAGGGVLVDPASWLDPSSAADGDENDAGPPGTEPIRQRAPGSRRFPPREYPDAAGF